MNYGNTRQQGPARDGYGSQGPRNGPGSGPRSYGRPNYQDNRGPYSDGQGFSRGPGPSYGPSHGPARGPARPHHGRDMGRPSYGPAHGPARGPAHGPHTDHRPMSGDMRVPAPKPNSLDAVSEFKQLVNSALVAEGKDIGGYSDDIEQDSRIPASSEDESLLERFDHDDILAEDEMELPPEQADDQQDGPAGIDTFESDARRSGGGGSGGKNSKNRMRPRNLGMPRKHSAAQPSNSNLPIPPLAPGNIRVIPLGGVEEIGMNMTVIEIGNDIIVIDAGFKFKDSDTPGIDYILPNTKYLEERKDRVRAMLITHGHLDHIGALPFIMDRIGNPPIYTRNLTSLMLKKRQAEFPHLKPFDFKIIEGEERLKIGEQSVIFYGVNHSIPDSMGIAIETPHGLVTTPGDFKLDHRDGVLTADEEKNYALFDKHKVLLFLGESTNIENPGFSTPDHIVHENLEEIVRNASGRLILGMFSSHINRIAHVITACEKLGKKVIIEGRSMKNNVDITIQAGILKVDKKVFISPQEIDQYPPDKIIVIATGAQGEEFAFLMRVSNNQYKHFKLNERDTVVLSSSIVPGNEKAVQKLKDSIARQGARLMHYRTSDIYIHSTGHGNRGEIEWLHRKLRPKFFIPIHGQHFMLKLHAELAEQLGIPKTNIVIPDDGTIIEVQEGGEKIVRLPVKAPDNVVMVDGFTIGDIQDVVIRDRQILSQDGIYVVVGIINSTTGRLKKSPDIISRGSVYLRESQELLREIRFLVKNTVEQVTRDMRPVDIDYVKDVVSDVLGRFIFQQTAKRPIIIPVMICV